MKGLRRWLLVLPAVAVLSACGGMAGSGGGTGGTGGTASNGQVEVKAANVTIGGRSQSVLTDASGKTLYYFLADSGGKMACTGSCTAEWKPVTVSGGGGPKAGQGVTGMLSTMPGASGTVATYNGWPLYTYVGDSKPGMASGEGVNDFGAQWFAVRVDVRPNQTAASPSAPGAPAPAPTSTYNNGY